MVRRKVNDPFPFGDYLYTHVHLSLPGSPMFLGTIGFGASESEIISRFRKQLLLDPTEEVALLVYFSTQIEAVSGICVPFTVYGDNPYLCSPVERLALAATDPEGTSP